MEYNSERVLPAVLSVAILAMVADVVVNMFFDSSSDEEEFEHAPDRRLGQQPFRTRRQFERKDYAFSQGARMLNTDSHLNPDSRDFRDFRSIYRIPPQFFESFCQWFQAHNTKDGQDCTGRPAVPLKLKLLSCFFMLAHGVSALAMSAVIGCDQETVRVFFLHFIRTIKEHLAPLHIKLPETEADLAAAVATYAEESLPGCFGSIDCTHIGWVRARAAVHSWFVGKEGVPTVAFQVIVDHTTKVAHC